ncbi:MAG: class I SAM-dependent methyltransferase [Rhodospirillaceae bacterium]
MKRRIVCSFAILGFIAGVFSFADAADAPNAALKAAISDSFRQKEHAVRDPHRHPYETLVFWGLKPGLSVIEIAPGGGYWTEILAPYAKASGGRYTATMPDESNPQMSEAARKNVTAFKARYADEAKLGKVGWVAWSPSNATPLGPPGSADMVITARNLHDFIWFPGQLEKSLKDFHAVLKPGGILAVEDHRADPRKQVIDARDGYVSTDYLVAAVEKAGFKLDASSEINANPKDTKDHPLGVWTLPPTNATSRLPYMLDWPGLDPNAKLDPEKYKAIGESDRMTLRFRKV